MIYYYGGKFNPITRGHVSVIDRLLKKNKDKIAAGEPFKLVIGVKGESNPGNPPTISVEYHNRYALVEAAVNELIATNWKGLHKTNASIEIVFQKINRTWAYFNSKPEWFPEDKNVVLVLGEDEYNDICKSTDPNMGKPPWLHAQDIIDNYDIEFFSRDSVISSTRVREIFRGNPYVEYNDVADYITPEVFKIIKNTCMYWQYGDESYARRKENEFLMSYDLGKFPRPSCTATVLVVCEGQVLLVRRNGHPYMHYWALPGGFLDVNNDETLEDTALRELDEETGLRSQISGSFTQFHTYSQRGQDPRGRIVDTVFLVDLKGCARYYNLTAGDDAGEVAWWPIDKLPHLAFHHKQVIDDYLRNMKEKNND